MRTGSAPPSRSHDHSQARPSHLHLDTCGSDLGTALESGSTEHSVQQRSSGSTAAAYIGLENETGNMSWGAGTDTDIIKAGVNALISAFNNMAN